MGLLRGVFGTSAHPSLAQQIGGKDPCIVWTRNPINLLPKLCSILLRAYESRRVEHRYPVINNINLVRDPSDISRLDVALDAVLATNPHHDVTLAPPEIVNWEEVQWFRIEGSRAPPPAIDLQFSAIRTRLAPNPPTVGGLRSLQICTVRPDGTPGMQGWSAYDCVLTEISDPNNSTIRCILMAGDWYEVANSLIQQVVQNLRLIPEHTTRRLPNAEANDTEGVYNGNLATSNPESLALLDAKAVSYGGGRSRIEVCDLLSIGKQLYHIKDYHGSATLSHLFAQGTVSARLLLERDFRSEIRTRFGAIVQQVIPEANITPSEYEVVFGIICEPTRNIPVDLPFFSKLRLLEAVRELRRLGFTNTSTARISRNSSGTNAR